MADLKTFRTRTPESRLADLERHMTAQYELAENFATEVEALKVQIAELNLRVMFIMNTVAITRKLSAIADASGKIPAVRETLAQLYNAGGRDKLLDTLEAENAELDASEVQAEAAKDDAGETVHEDPAPTAPITH